MVAFPVCSVGKKSQENRCIVGDTIYQLLDEVEQNIVICQGRADQLFADA